MTNYKESIATIYSAFLLANITTEQPRRLTAMAYLITAFMDFKENKDKPFTGAKQRFAKHLANTLKESNLDSDSIYCELCLLRPSSLSAGVSAELVGCTGAKQFAKHLLASGEHLEVFQKLTEFNKQWNYLSLASVGKVVCIY